MSIKIPPPHDRRRIAEKVGIGADYLYQCMTGKRDIDPTEAIRIERETEGEVSRFDVCTKRGAQIWPEQWQKVLARQARAAQQAAAKAVGNEA
jgi:DNA-binding transcriptional regulator YdaS (Cro superfamily)